MENTVSISMERFEELLNIEARVEALEDLLSGSKSVSLFAICAILGIDKVIKSKSKTKAEVKQGYIDLNKLSKSLDDLFGGDDD